MNYLHTMLKCPLYFDFKIFNKVFDGILFKNEGRQTFGKRYNIKNNSQILSIFFLINIGL